MNNTIKNIDANILELLSTYFYSIISQLLAIDTKDTKDNKSNISLHNRISCMRLTRDNNKKN